MKKFERVKAVVSLDAIAHNFAEMKKNIAKGTKIVAVIKADGYGHGAEAIARLIEDYDYIWGFAVATPEEALQLRTFGVKKPILILGIVFEEYFTEMIAKEIRLTVCTYEMAQKLSEEAQRQGRDVHIHIGLDTGMSRIGFADRPCRSQYLRLFPLPVSPTTCKSQRKDNHHCPQRQDILLLPSVLRTLVPEEVPCCLCCQ